MKRILGLLVLLILVACAGTQTITGTQQQTSKQATTAVASQTVDVVEQIKQDTIAKNDITQQLVLPLNMKKGKVGEDFVFGLMFNLVNGQPGTYLAKAEFVEARDSSYNKIEVDKSMLNIWARVPDQFTIDKGGSQFLAVRVSPKAEIKSGVSTVPGTYMFEVQMYKVESGFVNKIDGVYKTVNVKIE